MINHFQFPSLFPPLDLDPLFNIVDNAYVLVILKIGQNWILAIEKNTSVLDSIMNNDKVTHEKLTNKICNLKQMINMHKLAIKIVMALTNVLPVTTYLKLNKI